MAVFVILDESIVSPVARRYTRVVNGSLVVCLSEYLLLRIVYHIISSMSMIAVYFRGLFAKRWPKGKSCSRQFRFTPSCLSKLSNYMSKSAKSKNELFKISCMLI